jgi:hypothetical protein
VERDEHDFHPCTGYGQDEEVYGMRISLLSQSRKIWGGIPSTRQPRCASRLVRRAD